MTGGQDPDSVTVTATNDQGDSVVQTVAVCTGPFFEVDAPAVLVDIVVPFPVDITSDPFPSLIGQFQRQLGVARFGRQSAGWPQLLSRRLDPNQLHLANTPHGSSTLFLARPLRWTWRIVARKIRLRGFCHRKVREEHISVLN